MTNSKPKTKLPSMEQRAKDNLRNWKAVSKGVSELAKDHLNVEDVRLAKALLNATHPSKNHSGLTIRLSNTELAEMSSLYKGTALQRSRKVLVDADVIRAEKDGKEHYVYEFLDPLTGMPFENELGSVAPVKLDMGDGLTFVMPKGWGFNIK